MITVAIVIIVVGVLLWLANAHIPMDATVKKILNVFVVVCLVLWLVYLVVGRRFNDIPVPTL